MVTSEKQMGGTRVGGGGVLGVGNKDEIKFQFDLKQTASKRAQCNW